MVGTMYSPVGVSNFAEASMDLFENVGKSFAAQRRTFILELLGCLPNRLGVRIHAYVLMGNHYYLRLETPQANLSRGMQWLNLSYGAWFNRRQSDPRHYSKHDSKRSCTIPKVPA
jgi:hypothetical protein